MSLTTCVSVDHTRAVHMYVRTYVQLVYYLSKLCHNKNCHALVFITALLYPLPSPSVTVQVSEHFQDFDPLRSGSISCSRFRQGLTAIGQPSLSHAEFTALCGAFRDPRKKDHVLWKEFLARVDRGGLVQESK